MNPLLKKLPPFRSTLTQEQRDTIDAMTPEQRTLFLTMLARQMIIRELPEADDKPLSIVIPDDLPMPDYGIITSAIGPEWAQDEIDRIVGKPPELEP